MIQELIFLLRNPTQKKLFFILYLKWNTSRQQADYNACFKVIIENSKSEVMKQISSIVNKKDDLGNTALHYATQKWPDYAVRQLLELGANIGIKNFWKEIPISKIRPQTMEEFLDEYCLTYEGDIMHENFSLTFQYQFLAPDAEALPEKYRNNMFDYEEHTLIKNDVDQAQALPETECLWYMGQSKEHRHLLKHPVITSFLWFKWERIRPYFNRNLRIYLLFVFLLTWSIFSKFGGESQHANIEKVFRGSYIAIFTLLVCLMVRDWWKDIQDALRAESLASSVKNSINPKLNINSPKMILQIFASNWLDLLMIAGMSLIFILDDLKIPILVLLSILIARELLQMAVSLKRYFSSFENWLELAMISLVIAIIANDGEDGILLNRHLAAIALVLS